MIETKDVPAGINSKGVLKIQKFSLSYMAMNPIMCMIAKRGSGKSWLCKDIIIFFKDKIPAHVIIAPTDSMSRFYSTTVPDIYVHYTYEPKFMELLLQRQNYLVKKARQKILEGKKFDPRILLIMDDCLADVQSWANDPAIQALFFNGRHYCITYILTMQHPLGIKPSFRGNIDYVFIFKDNIASNHKKIWLSYAGMFRYFEHFLQVYSSLTENWSCMVIDNRSTHNDPAKIVFWYKARTHNGMFQVGCPEYNRVHQQSYNPNWDNTSLSYNLFDKGNKVTVSKTK